MSVYAPDGPPIPTEAAPVRRGGVEPDSDPLQERSLAKLAGEQAVHNGFRGPTLIPRVGIMVGPRDPSGRFTWWPMQYFRALTGAATATVVCPGPGGRAVQYSDARDIGAWLVDMSMRGEGGLFNTVGPLRYETLSDVLTACEAAARDVVAERGRPRRQSVVVRKTASEDALRTALAAVPEEDRPLWYPEDQIPQQAIDSRAAFAAGLRFRSARRTAEDTLRWALGQKDAALTAFAQPPA